MKKIKIYFWLVVLLSSCKFETVHQYNARQLERLNRTNDSILWELRKMNMSKVCNDLWFDSRTKQWKCR